ncbi:uncharacterized protein UV8b_05430 [Ustilaginoidea virens]|uniref:FAD-binding FR-type domain-containing protein n=1 Tax=Ustilaginoidea virens TaxID=1159556 RepID=A0A1B5L4Y3_USTVR|nr:uncharacterized protein UV8b_05430 [Ustilaginoidea virens]QUC21187.1 hypothetical protein UV8b_05430 [Ustilaginoidea virens]GAO18602.1 hypothetical protein UVI_02061950 [Ustilaginoidea virens]
MGWPYEFLTRLTHQEALLRRQSIDLYACIAHYSALVPAVVFLLYRILQRVVKHERARHGSASSDQGRYTAVPGSPTAKAGQHGLLGQTARRMGMAAWWLRDDVVLAGCHWGQRDEWLLGALWTGWLLVLAISGTGKDYFHLTKRFGAIAVSQLPIQNLLGLKALNPFAWIFRSSHEHVNRYHRVLGRIIYGFLLTHLLLYNAYFIAAGVWPRRLLNPVVFFGLLASFGFHGMTATAVRAVRQYSYRLFFITHLIVALSVPILLFLHASSTRLYVVEAMVVFAIDVAVRRITAMYAPSVLETVPGTSLVKVTCSIPAHRLASFRTSPGSHVYLSIPPSSRTMAVPSSKSRVFDFLFNPFTVAAVDDDEGTISLISRTRNGPMTSALSDLSSAMSLAPTAPAAESRKIALCIDGPYGTMTSRFKDLLLWGPSRVLLVAGGVGATFIVPTYQALQNDYPAAKTQLVWSIRGAGDATWAVSNSASGKGLLDDPDVHIFLTGDMGVDDDNDNAAGGGGGGGVGAVEMFELRRVNNNGRLSAHHNRRRPNIQKLVDDVFRHGQAESVAVLVCGPEEMVREVRLRVRPWVMRGRSVWWHSEAFGW